MLIADASAGPRVAALDLAAQAEHGADSPAILICSDRPTLDAIVAAYDELTERHRALGDGRLSAVEVSDLDEALSLADAIAPEHLELHCADAAEVAQRVGAAGAVFYGPGGGAAFGDYVAGSNHVLPTGGVGPLQRAARREHV